MYKEMASLIRDGMPASDSENGSNQQLSEENKQSAGSDEEDDDEDDDFGTDRDIDWKDARQRKKSPFRGVATEPHKAHQKNALEEEIKHDNNDKQYFDHTLQTIQEAGSEAEGTFQNTDKVSSMPANGQDMPRVTTEESDDREDMVGDDESSTDVSATGSQPAIRNDFTFMGNEDNSIFEEISKFTSVEQYREFLEKEIGDEKLMKAYPKLKEFVSIMFTHCFQGDNLLFSEKTAEVEALLDGILTKQEVRKY